MICPMCQKTLKKKEQDKMVEIDGELVCAKCAVFTKIVKKEGR